MVERRRDRAPMSAPKPIEPPEHLKTLAAGPIDTTVALMFWKLRNQFPEFAVTISEHDIKGMTDSFTYQEQTPKLICDARKDYLVLRIADAVTGDMIRVSENNEADLQIAERARELRLIKERIPVMVAEVRMQLSQGITSQDSLSELCRMAEAVAKS